MLRFVFNSFILFSIFLFKIETLHSQTPNSRSSNIIEQTIDSYEPSMPIVKPNIIVILSDDIGYSDIGCYGGEIDTPNLDALANSGLRFSQFYNGARCCPTRASLLTGLYAHQAGVGYMTGKLGNSPEYQGHIKKSVKTIAEYTKEAGYTTLHVGKWHVGNTKNKTMPKDKGFDRSWVPMGRVNYWNFEQVYEDGNIRPITKAEDIYLTDTEGDKALEYIDYAVKKDAPFFMYLAFNAAHWPLQAKKTDISKYKGKFIEGWDVLQERRIKRLDSIGLVSYKAPQFIIDESTPLWSTISEKDKYPGYNPVASQKHDQEDWDLKMAVYAAQIDNMDQNIGRVINKLKELGQYENTIIIYLQDNGACAEAIGKPDKNTPGTPKSYISYGLPWANLSNTPFQMYKHFLHEGGIATPFIFHWPKGIENDRKGKIEKENFGHIVDVVPTCLNAAGIKIDELPKYLEGESLLEIINGASKTLEKTRYWEHEGNRAIRKGNWKMISRYEDDYLYFVNWGWKKAPREKEWELYNMAEDRWELNDISNENPKIVEELKKKYEHWYNRIGAIPRKEVIKGTQHETLEKKRKVLYENSIN